MEFLIKDIVNILKGDFQGDENAVITGISEISHAQKGDITFLSNPKYEKEIYETSASVVIVSNTFTPKDQLSCNLIKVDDPYTSFATLLGMVEEMQKPRKIGIAASAIISEQAEIGREVYIGENSVIHGKKIGENTYIDSNVYIGEEVVIGNNCHIFPGVQIMDRTVIGDYCRIHPGAVIGSDGFGFAPQSDGSFQRIPQIGNVILEDYVSIGANSTIDRATIRSTIIRKGVKIDNLVQVAHNCEIGENTVIAAQTGIAGSSKIGGNCMIGGQAGVSGHITIADGTKIGPQAGVMSNVNESGKELIGSPVINVKEYMRVYAASRKVPELIKRVQSLENKID